MQQELYRKLKPTIDSLDVLAEKPKASENVIEKAIGELISESKAIGQKIKKSRTYDQYRKDLENSLNASIEVPIITNWTKELAEAERAKKLPELFSEGLTINEWLNRARAKDFLENGF